MKMVIIRACSVYKCTMSRVIRGVGLVTSAAESDFNYFVSLLIQTNTITIDIRQLLENVRF